MMKTLCCAIVAVVLLTGTAGAQIVTDCWDFWDFSDLWVNHTGSETVSVMVVPDGSGDALDAVRTQGGATVDATINLILRDCNSVPIPNFPFEDMWLGTLDGGLFVCIGGGVADVNTDATGATYWRAPLRAGGMSTAGCIVFVNGIAMLFPPLNMHFNSPDINRDRTVNLIDISQFASDLFSGYDYRSDLYYDGVINLSDVVRLSEGLGASCP